MKNNETIPWTPQIMCLEREHSSPIRFMEETFINPIDVINQFDTKYNVRIDNKTPEGKKALEERLSYVCDAAENQRRYTNNCLIEGIKHQNAMELEHEKARNRMAVAEYSARLKERQLEGIAIRKENTKNAWDKLSMDEYGVLEVVSMYPDNRPESRPRALLDITHLRMTQIYAKNYYSERAAVITWDNIDEPIVLIGEGFSPAGLGKEFNKHGVRIHCGGNYKKEKLELIWNYLVGNSNKVERPAFLGWNLTKDGWEFQDKYEDTFEGLIGGGSNVY